MIDDTPTPAMVDKWLLTRQTIKHLDRIGQAPMDRPTLIARLDVLLAQVEEARRTGADQRVTCPNPSRIGGGWNCRCEPSCNVPERAFVSDLGELEALMLLYGRDE